MGRYTVSRENITPTAGNDVLTLISGANRRIRLVYASFNGRGTTSASQGVTIARSAVGTTPGGAITPSKTDNSDQPAANFTTATTWSVQPVLETNGESVSWNALGGRAPFGAPQNKAPFEARNGETISIRAAAAGVTFQAASITVIVDED